MIIDPGHKQGGGWRHGIRRPLLVWPAFLSLKGGACEGGVEKESMGCRRARESVVGLWETKERASEDLKPGMSSGLEDGHHADNGRRDLGREIADSAERGWDQGSVRGSDGLGP